MIGRTLAHYEILSLLGRGGMGEVYRARDTRLGRDVALKVLPDDLARDAERRARFEREARAIASLNHPNVVTIYAVEEIEDQLLLSMEVIEGQTLGEVIPEGGLPLARLLDLAVPLADALAIAHARGITHRDLKPANIMIRPDGRVTVLDFGLAKLIAGGGPEVDDQTVAVEATSEGVVLGTAAYMSPEQAEGKPVDPRSDVFSLGVLLYQMATGEKPFAGDTPISTITSVLRDEPRSVAELKPELPTQLGRIIARCLRKDPDQRYDTAKGLMFELEGLQEDSSSSDFAAAGRTSGGGRRRAVLLGGPLLLIVVVAGLVLMGRDGHEAVSPSDLSREGRTVATTEQSAETVPTVVVFPFENRGEADDAYFADGISDEIATRLVGMEGLAVLSRSSARNYDRQGKTIGQIAEDLGVDYMLEGSVRWQRDPDGSSQVRISPVLVQTTEDVQVWADSYDRDMSEIFAIQREIASAVANQISAAIAPANDYSREQSQTRNMDAYHLLLRARQAIDKGQLVAEEWGVAHTLLKNALEKDPTYALAWAYLARVEAGYCHFNWDRTDERLGAARRAAARARELAPGSADEHLAHGYVDYWGEKRYAEATREFEAALALRPADVETMEALGYVARREGRYEDALAWLERAALASPSDSRLAFNISETLLILRRYEQALMLANRALEYDPGAPTGYAQRARTLANMGRIPEAIDVLQDSPRKTALTHAFLAAMATEALDAELAAESAALLPDYDPEQFRDISGLVDRAYVAWLQDGRDAARAEFRRAVDVMRAVVADDPSGSNPTALLAEALAGAGEFDEAVALAESALDLYPADRDDWIRTERRWDLARVLLLAGRSSEAETLLRDMCARPGMSVSREFLRAAPLYQAGSPIPEFAVVEDFGL